jgi:DNA-binding XRE family transcriptional regulator
MSVQTTLDRAKQMGLRIKAERGQMSGAELGKRIGVTRQTVNDWEHGKIISMKAAHLLALADAFCVPVEYLWAGGDRRKNVGHLYDEPTSEEEAAIGREWGKLQEPQRSVMAETIHLHVAAQKRADRKPPPVVDKGDPKGKRKPRRDDEHPIPN